MNLYENIKKNLNESEKLKEADYKIWSNHGQEEYYENMSREEMIEEIKANGWDEEEINGESILNSDDEALREYLTPQDIDLDYEDYENSILPMIEKQCYGDYLVLSGQAANWRGKGAACKAIKVNELENYLMPSYDATIQLYCNSNDDLYYTEANHDTPIGGTEMYLYSFKDETAYNNAEKKLQEAYKDEDWDMYYFCDWLSYEEAEDLINSGILTPVKRDPNYVGKVNESENKKKHSLEETEKFSYVAQVKDKSGKGISTIKGTIKATDEKDAKGKINELLTIDKGYKANDIIKVNIKLNESEVLKEEFWNDSNEKEYKGIKISIEKSDKGNKCYIPLRNDKFKPESGTQFFSWKEVKDYIDEKLANLKESSTEDYWDATELDRVGFMALLKFNHPENHMNPSIQYIITNDNNEVYRFAMQGNDEKTKDTGAKLEFRRYINKEESENNKNKSIYGTKKELFEKFPELKNNRNYDSYADDDYMAVDFDENNKIKGIRLATKDTNESEKLNESIDGYISSDKFDDMSDEDLDKYVKFLKDELVYHAHKKQEEMLKDIEKIEQMLKDRDYYIDFGNPETTTIKFDDKGNEISSK